jgi:hypothetical protein
MFICSEWFTNDTLKYGSVGCLVNNIYHTQSNFIVCSSLLRSTTNAHLSLIHISWLHFVSFGATAPILALAYLHETLRFTSVY